MLRLGRGIGQLRARGRHAIGVSKTAVSRSVIELEQRLGARLFQRSTQHLAPLWPQLLARHPGFAVRHLSLCTAVRRRIG
ncbi:LysR family transcriptional regulator [Variovorax sp. N23]|uniref:helix-turn-helix domain-containing protein n=1 Tax=Variovorax sp. N23 TaxID=2980555 RepID=UPI0029167E63|nr:LysR family transcriptional regulator [Variovorax sp. N23]